MRLRSYARVLRSLGWQGCWTFFLETHLFDLLNQTDTSNRAEDSEWNEWRAGGIESVPYCPSWTSVTLQLIHKVVDAFPDARSGTWVDLGAGKGKVVIIFAQELSGIAPNAHVIGCEIDEALVGTARQNLMKLGILDTKAEIICADARNLKFKDAADPLILYAYNPFACNVLDQVLRNLEGRFAIFIYVNPQYDAPFVDRGWSLIGQNLAGHPNSRFRIWIRDYD